MALSLQQRQHRLRFDWAVCQRMFGPIFSGEAYASVDDLERRQRPITSEADAHRATAYRVDFFVPTLIGPGRFADVSAFGFNLGVGDYPYSEPATWIISELVPYSPHFRRGAPICIGEIWREARGRMLLGQLFVHVAKMLNWDEVARGGGYVGWNGEAIAYHREHYGIRPLNSGLHYPALPTDLTHGLTATPAGLFAVAPLATGLFSPTGDAPTAPPNLFSPGDRG